MKNMYISLNSIPYIDITLANLQVLKWFSSRSMYLFYIMIYTNIYT